MKKYTIAILMLPIAVLAVINFTSDKSQVKSAAIDCATYQNIQQCWDDQIDAALKDQGLAESFRLVSQLYQAEPLFTSDCHGYVHKLGESTYFSYKKGEQINLPPETAYCGYGFYHGFMEKLLTDGGHIVDAGHFCDYAAQRVTTVLADACYHGAGHGAMALSTADPALWSKPGALVSKSTKICNQLSGDEIKISRCNSGVFMEIANYFIGGEYKLEPDSNDPLGICLSQPDDLKMDCYTQMYAVLRKISGNNFQKAVVFVERIKGDRYAEESIQTLAGASRNHISMMRLRFAVDFAVIWNRGAFAAWPWRLC